MKPRKKAPSARSLPDLPASNSENAWDRLPAALLALTLFLAPLFPDEKLSRWKLVALGIGLIAAFLAWALSRLPGRFWTWRRTPADPFLTVYALAAFAFYRASPEPAVAVSELQRMVFSVGAFFLAAQACAEDGRRRSWVMWGWVAGLSLASVYGLLQTTGGIGRLAVPKLGRIYATFGNPIFFAAFLVASIPAAAGLALSSEGWARRIAAACALVALCALFRTGTRAAFLALPLASIAGWVLLERSWDWEWTRRLWARRNLALAFLILAFMAGLPLRRDLRRAIAASRATATRQTHTLIWRDVLRMWRAHPWLGTGYGTFHVEFPAYASDELKRVFPPDQRIINDAHNEYLQILAETGVVGLAIFLALLVALFRPALRFLGRAPEEERPLYAGLLTGSLAVLIQNFFSVDMRFIVSSVYLFLGLGLAASFYAEPAVISWPGGGFSKAVWAVFWVGVTGLAGFRPGERAVYVAGLYRIGPGGTGWTPASGPGLIPGLLRPYLASREVAAAPDFFDQKRLDAARTIADLENLVRQSPGQWQYWERLGFELAREIERKDASGRKIIDLGVAQRAIAAYRKANELNPRAPGPLNNLGNIYYTLHKPDEAFRWWRKAVEENPDNLDARLNLGIAYYQEGRLKESAAELQEVLRRDPRNERALVLLKRMVE